jgi:GntR family transcriptional repressor for pyruvate dehydrogenase complex
MPTKEPENSISLRPVSNRRLSDVIAEQLTQAVRRAGLQPGDRLPTEHELARQLGVGRTSVREGLQRLQTLGLIEVRKGSGAYVAEPQSKDPIADFAGWIKADGAAVESFAELRIGVEGFAATLAALRATEEDVNALVRHHVAHEEAGDDDITVLTRTDESFHEAVFQASGNSALARIYSLLIVELTDFRRRTLSLPWAHGRSAAGHRAVVEAIAAHDPRRARSAMLDHLWPLYVEIHEAGGTGADVLPHELLG